MSSSAATVFWQAKIWGLLHDPTLRALHDGAKREELPFWQNLAVMKDWTERGWNPETSSHPFLRHLGLADLIASASDRGAIGAGLEAASYGEKGIEISHLLSGKKLNLKLSQDTHEQLRQSERSEFLQSLEKTLIPEAIKQESDPRKVFWWLWRCLPASTCKAFEDESLLLLPAEKGLPDTSIWNHASLASAMAGSLTGYDLAIDDIENWQQEEKSHPYLAAFSFTPVQELIKASRKMRDFWAGSWILHYLSAKVCWALAWKYGPDSFIYPNLFEQPLIDHWILEKFPEFDSWVDTPTDRHLLTAGFPNVLILVLPKDKVQPAMQYAEETLKREWLQIGHLVFEELAGTRRWMQKLKRLDALTEDHKTWKGWLNPQWQVYWSALAIGKEGEALKGTEIPEEAKPAFKHWLDTQNKAFEVIGERQLFQKEELDFIRQVYEHDPQFNVNVGSWWSFIFGKTRSALAGIKNSRTWELPVVFSSRSTVSGLGPAVHPGDDWLPEGVVKDLWKRHAGLFDGREQLNATETVKRGLHKVLTKLFKIAEKQIEASYPDLTAGVAGYLKTHQDNPLHLAYFHQVCQSIIDQLQITPTAVPKLTEQKWGVPWIDESANDLLQKYHSRFLNAGWLSEEVNSPSSEALEKQIDKEQDPGMIAQLNRDLLQLRREYRQEIQTVLDRKYASNNPGDWYVLAVGDGDGMNEWLRGSKLKAYEFYTSSTLSVPESLKSTFEKFVRHQKRMGPSTHGALSRALLDFSNQLVPYLTEERYAGRLIYGGGDDVMAYTNLWEWDNWLWDIRQCFQGEQDPEEQRLVLQKGNTSDPKGYFKNQGDYWLWQGDAQTLSKRPRFTMGKEATISFGVVIAHHSVPLAIALESLWDAEKQAKKHCSPEGSVKDAVQVRVLYGNGNSLEATAKFDVFHQWQAMLEVVSGLEPALFEQAAQVWDQHPAPVVSAISTWAIAFCNRRDFFNDDDQKRAAFCEKLERFLVDLWKATEDKISPTTGESKRDCEIKGWLKLAAFVLRKRQIQIPTQKGGQS
ncbi:type III-B CRISPR-associated protein Cas10/Cmr2 [Oculatella sp. FACHB-28]|uniref:type III-B CRISPR-associated protein Cas10/Cmr2 n=1 Tax=Oculatella sp. FACHB-28 TaxID=2692845 RepID=UPI003220109B